MSTNNGGSTQSWKIHDLEKGKGSRSLTKGDKKVVDQANMAREDARSLSSMKAAMRTSGQLPKLSIVDDDEWTGSGTQALSDDASILSDTEEWFSSTVSKRGATMALDEGDSIEEVQPKGSKSYRSGKYSGSSTEQGLPAQGSNIIVNLGGDTQGSKPTKAPSPQPPPLRHTVAEVAAARQYAPAPTRAHRMVTPNKGGKRPIPMWFWFSLAGMTILALGGFIALMLTL